jgi:tetratricopeptide (TPR) repeat protein
VAGSQVTRAAIYLVETGRARPSQRTLKLIATRTNKPLAFFLEAEAGDSSSEPARARVDARLEQIEAMVSTGKLKPAMAASKQLLRALGSSDQALQGRVRLRLAEAQLESGRALDALPNLRVARELLASDDAPELLAECGDLLGLALKKLEDRDALAAFNEALRLCRQALPVRKDLEARILGHIGAAYASTHDWEAAISHYEQALEAAGNVRDLSFLERMYNDVGLAEMGAGHLTAAFGYFQKALALAEVSNQAAVIARIENNIGSALVGLEELDAAESHLRRSLQICKDVDLDVGRGHVLCSCAELELARGDFDRAGAYAKEAVAVTARVGEALTEADAHQLAGQAAEARGDRDGADAAYRRALRILAGQNAPHRLMECHLGYASLLESRGDYQGALRQSREALLAAQPQLRSHPIARLSRPASTG